MNAPQVRRVGLCGGVMLAGRTGRWVRYRTYNPRLLPPVRLPRSGGGSEDGRHREAKAVLLTLKAPAHLDRAWALCGIRIEKITSQADNSWQVFAEHLQRVGPLFDRRRPHREAQGSVAWRGLFRDVQGRSVSLRRVGYQKLIENHPSGVHVRGAVWPCMSVRNALGCEVGVRSAQCGWALQVGRVEEYPKVTEQDVNAFWQRECRSQ